MDVNNSSKNMVSQKESFQFRLISYNVHKKLRKTSYYLHRLLAAIKVRTLVPIMVKKFAPLNAPFHILVIVLFRKFSKELSKDFSKEQNFAP